MGFEPHSRPGGPAESRVVEDAHTCLSPSTRARSQTSLCGMALQRRDPVNELYDRACDLLYAADQFRSAAARSGATDGVVATLGCLEACFDALKESVASIRARALEHLNSERVERSAAVELMSTELDGLAQELEGVGRAAGVARATVAASILAAAAD